MTEKKNTAKGAVASNSGSETPLPDEKRLLLSSSPHVHDTESVRRIMIMVIIALTPACLTGIWLFGVRALLVIVYCTFFSVALEILWCWMAGRRTDTWKDCSAIVTGIILALNLSAGIPWWVCLIGAFLAIGLGKQIYGGLGYNPFNPAIVARVGLLIAFPKLMTTWVPTRFMPSDTVYNSFIDYNHKIMDKAGLAVSQIKGHVIPFFSGGYDGVTCATPLGVAKTAKELVPDGAATADIGPVFSNISGSQLYWDYFWGNVGGCIGETSVVALLAGAVFLLVMKIIKWQVPVSYIATVAVITGLVNLYNPGITPPPLFHIITGGLIFGACFIATDMVTSPMTPRGMLLFGFGCGVLTCLIRIWGNYPEGVSFSILFMNALVPLIDRFTAKKPFGYRPSRTEGRIK